MPTQSKATHRPNILVIMTDQQRSDTLGCYGATWIDTPNLDRLARQGTRFARCTVNNPICTPSRASIMTGKELPGHGVYRLHDRLPDDEVMFPERLRREAGYRTGLFGKLHVSGRVIEEEERHPHDGFEDYEWCIEACVGMDSRFNGYVSWLRRQDPDFLADLYRLGRKLKHHPAEVHLTRWAADRSIDFMRRHAHGEAPFFCMMSIFDPHNPYEGYPPEAAKFVHEDAVPTPLPKQSMPLAVQRERDGSYLGAALDPDAIRKMRFGYGAAVGFLDQEIGRVLAELDNLGIADETLVIFTSDHGDALGDHGMMVKGVALYDPVVKVPLILRWPGHVPVDAVSGALAQGHDLARTCLAAAKLDPPREGLFDTGLDWVTQAVDPFSGREFAVCAYRNSGINAQNDYWDPVMKSTSVTSSTHKLIAYTSGDVTEFEFFDLIADPGEQQDRLNDPTSGTALVRHMQALVCWLQREAGEPGSRGGSREPAASNMMNNLLTG
jgi:arylsulfatase